MNRTPQKETHMNNDAPQPLCEIGMIGLGVMGRNFLMNMAGHGFPVAGYDNDEVKVEVLRHGTRDNDVRASGDIRAFVSMLRAPRAIMLLVPAGPAVDSVISELVPLLDHGDLIIDAGNSHYTDTDVRAKFLANKRLQFLGIGMSGGGEGALDGPSIMVGGTTEAYARVQPVFEAAAAQFNGSPSVARVGSGSAGHFVKMVHNGIEYAVMQLIAETYDLMKRGLGMDDEAIHDVYASWNTGPLAGYLMEITSRIFTKQDGATGLRLIDEILDVAKQKGTGLWTSQSAMELQVPLPTIDLAVSMRDMSVLDAQRQQAGPLYQRPVRRLTGDHDAVITELGSALVAAMMITYAQGMALLSVASSRHGSHLDLAEVARIWRGGCIIRSAMLDDIGAAFRARPGLPNLLLDPAISRTIMAHQEALREVVSLAAASGTPIPAMMVSLAYLDAYRSSWLPANLIQAQRDYFGAHTYERNDCKGTFHTSWESQ
jgi:6-phosphogluconate dehydrogenase